MPGADSLWRIHVVDDLSGELVDRVADFFDEHFPGVFGGPCDPDVFRWKLGDGNPAGKGILALALTEAGVIAGVMTATMKRMVVDGQTLLGAETGDTFTHPDFRRSGAAAEPSPGTEPDDYLNRSVFGRLVNDVSDLLTEQGVEVVYGTPNDQSRPGYCRRGGYEEAPGAAARSWHCPRAPLFRSRFPMGTGAIAARGFDLLGTLLRGPGVATPDTKSIRLGVDTPETTFQMVDRILDNGPSGPQIAVLQDGAWIRHRYAHHPSQAYVLHIIGPSSAPTDFIVTRTITRSHGATTRCIAELSPGLGDDPRLRRSALRAMTEKADDVDTVSIWTDDRRSTRLRMVRSGFIPISTVAVVLGTNAFGRRSIDAGQAFPMQIGWSDNV